MGQRFSPYAREPGLQCDGMVGFGDGFRFGASKMKGWRKNQEDTYKLETELHENMNYFAVFDGHGGSEVAKYLERNLHDDIKDFLREGNDPELSLFLGFLSCDSSLREPSGIEELNAFIEAENQVTLADMAEYKRRIFSSIGMNTDGSGCSKDVSVDLPTSSSCLTDSNRDNMDDQHRMSETIANDTKNTDNGNPENLNDINPENLSDDNPENLNDDNPENLNNNSHSEPSSSIDQGNASDPMDTLNYLLKEDLENSDPEDDDFDIEDEESSEEESGEEESFDVESLEPGVHSGSTGTVLLMDLNNYYCANVGDSRCVLCRGGKAIDLSDDHKPDDPEESKRIAAAGARVYDGRIERNLNLSRAFGDFYYKKPLLPSFLQVITIEPSIRTLAMDESDEFVVIASDGIWNSLSSQELVDFIRIRLTQEENLRTIEEELFRLILAPDTYHDGGCDNMTIIIIKLEPSLLKSNIIANREKALASLK